MRVPCGSVSVFDGMGMVDIFEADVERVRPGSSTNRDQYERSAKERGVFQEVRQFGLALFWIVNRPEVVHDWRHANEEQRDHHCTDEWVETECDGQARPG